MLWIACVALSLLLVDAFPLGAQTVNAKMAARVSDKNLTRGQRKMGDDLWVGLFMELGKPLPKTDPLSLEQAAAFLGWYRAHDDSTSITLSFFADGTWKITGIAFGSPMDPGTGRWILRRNRIEVWDQDFGDPAGDNNALRSEVFQKGKQWYAIEISTDGGVVKLTKLR